MLPPRCGRALALLSALIAAAAAQSVSPTPSPSPYGVCGGANVAYQYNVRPQFVALLSSASAGVSSPMELRLCLANGTSVDNIGLTALSLDVSKDGGGGGQCAWGIAHFL